VTALKDVKIDHGTVLGKVKAQWGSVTAIQSKLGHVFAHHHIDLTDSSAESLRSKRGRVTANRSQLQCVSAHYNIDLTNSAAADVHSKWGNVAIRQPDGITEKTSRM